MNKYYIMFSHDGITREYMCDTYFDAVVLFDIVAATRSGVYLVECGTHNVLKAKPE